MFAAAAIVMLLQSRHRKHLTALALCLVIILSIPAYLSFDTNVDLDRYGPHEKAQRSAAYREELIKYIVIARGTSRLGLGFERLSSGGWHDVGRQSVPAGST